MKIDFTYQFFFFTQVILENTGFKITLNSSKLFLNSLYLQSKRAHLILPMTFYTCWRGYDAISCCAPNILTVQNLTRNLRIFIGLEGIFLTPLLHILTYCICHSHTALLITHTTSTAELHTQHTAIYHLQTWEDKAGRRLLPLPLCLLYFILFRICGFSFL